MGWEEVEGGRRWRVGGGVGEEVEGGDGVGEEVEGGDGVGEEVVGEEVEGGDGVGEEVKGGRWMWRRSGRGGGCRGGGWGQG